MRKIFNSKSPQKGAHARILVAIFGQVQSISGWLSKNCDENSRMHKISYSKFPPKCAHARILVAIFGQPTGNRLYSSFQVGCPKIATRIRACAPFGGDFELKILRMRGFSSRFLDNQPENCCIRRTLLCCRITSIPPPNSTFRTLRSKPTSKWEIESSIQLL